MSATVPSLLLHEYLPNHGGGGRYQYDATRRQVVPSLQSDKAPIQGYLIPFWETLTKRRKVIVFAREKRMYIDLGDGPLELLPVPAKTTYRVVGRTIAFHTDQGPKCLKVFTPFWRHLTNDGMFPEDAEPIVHLIEKLSDSSKRQRWLAYFTTGRWPEA